MVMVAEAKKEGRMSRRQVKNNQRETKLIESTAEVMQS
jgi:hypothetical protein